MVIHLLIYERLLIHKIILGTSQPTKSSKYTHDVIEQDTACILIEQYPHHRKQFFVSIDVTKRDVDWERVARPPCWKAPKEQPRVKTGKMAKDSEPEGEAEKSSKKNTEKKLKYRKAFKVK